MAHGAAGTGAVYDTAALRAAAAECGAAGGGTLLLAAGRTFLTGHFNLSSNTELRVEGTLLGSPYSVNQAMPASTAGLKSVLFGDFGKYYVRKVGAPVIGVMRERFWPDLGIAGLIRFDGELADTAAVKHLAMA
jgi:hypothetical protein